METTPFRSRPLALFSFSVFAGILLAILWTLG